MGIANQPMFLTTLDPLCEMHGKQKQHTAGLYTLHTTCLYLRCHRPSSLCSFSAVPCRFPPRGPEPPGDTKLHGEVRA